MSSYRIHVQVEPQHLPEQSDADQSVHAFAYTVTITNTGDVPAQLISRHWQIHDANGHREEVKGLGVVGKQPLLKPGEAFQYTSGCRLRTPSGTMNGHYFFVAEDGERFDVPIPLFLLEAHSSAHASARVLH